MKISKEEELEILDEMLRGKREFQFKNLRQYMILGSAFLFLFLYFSTKIMFHTSYSDCTGDFPGSCYDSVDMAKIFLAVLFTVVVIFMIFSIIDNFSCIQITPEKISYISLLRNPEKNTFYFKDINKILINSILNHRGKGLRFYFNDGTKKIRRLSFYKTPFYFNGGYKYIKHVIDCYYNQTKIE